MSRDSSTRDLRMQIKTLGVEKRKIDKQIEDLKGAIQVFEAAALSWFKSEG